MFGEYYECEEDFIDDLEDSVIDWFNNNCDEDGYDNSVQRVRDLEVMADNSNDMAIDDCISSIEDKFGDIDLENYRDVIGDRLAQCASDELNY